MGAISMTPPPPLHSMCDKHNKDFPMLNDRSHQAYVEKLQSFFD
jgi:hypothetical protein